MMPKNNRNKDEIDDDSDEVIEEDTEDEEEEPVRKQGRPAKQIEEKSSSEQTSFTKEEVGDILEAHLLRIQQLFQIYRNAK
jgi:hypothetical protein